jgi:uncharacterized protein
MSTSQASPGLSIPPGLIGSAATYVRSYMSRYDGSHDFAHIQRVVRLARYIHSQEQPSGADLGVVTLAALLHDIGDKKYITEGEDPTRIVRDVLVKLEAGPELAERVQKLCLGVSYSGEIKDPAGVRRLVGEYPERESLPRLALRTSPFFSCNFRKTILLSLPIF